MSALLAGRSRSESDTRERPFVAVVSQSFVDRYWPNQDPRRRFTELKRRIEQAEAALGRAAGPDA